MASSSWHHEVRPVSNAATNEYGQPGMNWVTGAARASVDVAEQAVRASRRVRTQPRRDIDRQYQAPVGGLRLRQHGQCLTQPVRIDAALVERVVQRAVPTPVLGQQRQIDRRGHRAVLTEHRVAELEQRVSAPGQTSVEVLPKVGGEVECLVPGIVVQQTCAVRCFDVSPIQSGGILRNIPGSPDLPGRESARGQEHVRKTKAVRRCSRQRFARPARYGQSWIA
jgi:hypothetical protein